MGTTFYGIEFLDFFSQPSLCSTWPCHLSWWVCSTFIRSSSCIISWRSCELTWSFLVTSHSLLISARSLRCNWCKSNKVGANVSLRLGKNFSQWESSFLWKLRFHWLKFLRRVAKTLVIQGPGAQIVISSSGGDGKWAGGGVGQEFEFSPCDTACFDGSEFTTSTGG